ncbi:hypothetical protein OH77DRAFT_1455259 [Trametes cingulata]|nr:hypothetical protein OH77DRAFT_1455259 [Trametes cingulata]
MLASQAAPSKRFGFFSPDGEVDADREPGKSPAPAEPQAGFGIMGTLGTPEYDMTIRLERLRVKEALAARDAAVSRLAEACTSVRQKADKIKHLTEEKEKLERQLETIIYASAQRKDQPADGIGARLPVEQTLENKLASLSVSENRPLNVGENADHGFKPNTPLTTIMFGQDATGTGVLKDVSNTPSAVLYATSTLPKDSDLPDSPWTPLDGERVVHTPFAPVRTVVILIMRIQAALPTASTAEKIEGRYAVLASLPLPSGIPDDALTPIVIPSPYTLHDFIGTTSGVSSMISDHRVQSLIRPLGSSCVLSMYLWVDTGAIDAHICRIGNYRVFQQSTTTWCPEREEHGYYLTPVFKCSTNPRVNTAHRWSAVDLAAKLDRPTAECFFNKDGKWYYAGIYKCLRLEDLCTQEWECLSTEASPHNALIKETLAGRKNTSPQNVYETGQLYSAGALKVACIGLQCIGFNDALYRGLLEHAAHCSHTGRWRAGGYSGGGTGLGFGTASGPGSPLNVNMNLRSPPGTMSPASGGVSSPAGVPLPGSPVATFASPGQYCGRVPGPGLGSAPSPIMNPQHLQDFSAAPGGRPAPK